MKNMYLQIKKSKKLNRSNKLLTMFQWEKFLA